MLYSLVLLHVGVMLFLSCIWLAGRISDKEISVINIFAILAFLAEERRTKIMVTYEVSFARKVSNQLLFFHQGVVEKKSSPEILDNPRSERLQQFLSNELKWQTLK
jgi:ABC-type histidine transport system ATPase subunit